MEAGEVGIKDLRARLADVLNGVSIRGRIIYITSRGRRVAAIVPVEDAEALEARKGDIGNARPVRRDDRD